MKIFLIVIFFYFYSYSVIAQTNLVINPSFEEYIELPVDCMHDGKSYAKGWYIPSSGSTDYFHLNCRVDYLQKARSELNFSHSRTGLASIGIIPLTWAGYMEHISGELSKPLARGRVYRVSFWIKYAGDVCQFATDRIGVLFTKTKFYLSPVSPFYESLYNKKVHADIESLKGDFIVNDSSWVQINFLYKAAGGEKYITIGKFYNEDIKLDLINKYRRMNVQFSKEREKFIRKKKNQKILKLNEKYNEEKNGVTSAYYFIDDVNVSLAEGFDDKK